MKSLSVKLPEPLAEWLLQEARARRRSRSDLVREALEARRRGGQNGETKPLTMAEALLSCGEGFDGPHDLSTNPKYFDGFGK